MFKTRSESKAKLKQNVTAGKATDLWVLGTLGLPTCKAKRCTSEERCESFIDNKHPNTFSGKKQLPIHEKYRIPHKLIDEILSCAAAHIAAHTVCTQRAREQAKQEQADDEDHSFVFL